MPHSSAATPTAPAPSTTSFVRSSRSTIASLICSSVTETTSSSSRSRMPDVSSPGCFTAMPSAIVNPGPPGSVPAACTPTMRMPGRTARSASAIPDASPPPPIGITTVSAFSTWSASSRPIVPWPATTSGSSNGCTNVAPLSATYARGRVERLLERRTGQLDLGAVRPRRLDLRHRRVLRHEDPRPRPHLACRPRDRLAVIAGARGDDSGGALLGAERRDAVVRAADLERARPLQVLRLQVQLAADEARDRLGAVDRRDARDPVEPGARRLDLRKSGCRFRHAQCGTPSRVSPARR